MPLLNFIQRDSQLNLAHGVIFEKSESKDRHGPVLERVAGLGLEASPHKPSNENLVSCWSKLPTPQIHLKPKKPTICRGNSSWQSEPLLGWLLRAPRSVQGRFQGEAV